MDGDARSHDGVLMVLAAAFATLNAVVGTEITLTALIGVADT